MDHLCNFKEIDHEINCAPSFHLFLFRTKEFNYNIGNPLKQQRIWNHFQVRTHTKKAVRDFFSVETKINVMLL